MRNIYIIGSITIGYGYDFKQEDDPDMFDKYLYVDDNGQIKAKDIMSLEDAEKTIEKAAIQKGIMLGLEWKGYGGEYAARAGAREELFISSQ